MRGSVTTPLSPQVQYVFAAAFIAAGTAVTPDASLYVIVVSTPGRIIKYRFESHIIKKIEATRWWEKDKNELARLLREQRNLIFTPEQYFE